MWPKNVSFLAPQGLASQVTDPCQPPGAHSTLTAALGARPSSYPALYGHLLFSWYCHLARGWLGVWWWQDPGRMA